MPLLPILFRPRILPSVVPSAQFLPPEQKARLTAMITKWQEIFNGVSLDGHTFKDMYDDEPDPVADLEDWTENAALLFGAIRTGHPIWIISDSVIPTVHTPSFGDRPTGETPREHRILTTLNGATGPAPVGNQPCITLGGMMVSDGGSAPGFWPKTNPRNAILTRQDCEHVDRYYDNPAFIANAGRKIEIAEYYDNEEEERQRPDVYETILRMGKETGSYVAKHLTMHKKIGLLFSEHRKPEEWTQTAVMRDLFDFFDYSLCHGWPILSISEKVHMEAEYRIFFIGGEIVCGAGCIEKYSPIWNTGNAFDPQIEDQRGTDTITTNPALVEQYKTFATNALAAFRAHDHLFLNGTIDLALMTDTQGQTRIGIIEINPASNAGQYALDTDTLVHAIVSTQQAEYAASTNTTP